MLPLWDDDRQGTTYTAAQDVWRTSTTEGTPIIAVRFHVTFAFWIGLLFSTRLYVLILQHPRCISTRQFSFGRSKRDLNAGAEEDPFENPWGPLADELAAGRKARKTKIKLRSVPANKVLLPVRAVAS